MNEEFEKNDSLVIIFLIGLFFFGYFSYVVSLKSGFLIFLIFSLVTMFLNIVFIFRLNKKYSLETKQINDYEYWRDVDFANIDPIHASFILNKKKVNIDGIIATIFLLELNGIFKISVLENDYYIELEKITNEQINQLKDYQQKIVKFLFSGIKDDRKLNLAEKINEIRKNYDKRIIINDICDNEQNNLILKFYKPFIGFFNDLGWQGNVIFGLLFVNVIFGWLFIVVSFMFQYDYSFLVVVSYLIQVMVLIYVFNRVEMRVEYLEEARKLKGLYNYLSRFTNLGNKQIKHYKLYEKFFLYAVGLGVANRFEKEFNQKEINSRFVTDMKILFKNNYFKENGD